MYLTTKLRAKNVFSYFEPKMDEIVTFRFHRF
jgi:hypothetical protein